MGAQFMAQIDPEGLQAEIRLIGFYFRRMENAVHEFKGLDSGGMNVFKLGYKVFMPCHIFSIFQKHLAVTDDSVQRCTQIVAQFCKDITPGLVVKLGFCRFGRCPGSGCTSRTRSYHLGAFLMFIFFICHDSAYFFLIITYLGEGATC